MSKKYIFVTGGVTSSLGKGIISASLGLLLKSIGFKVTIQKFDPYLNIDPAMSKITAAKYYRKKIAGNKLTREEAIKQISEILDIAIMIRYQDTKEFENHLRSLNGDKIVEVFTKNVKLSYF